MGILLLSLPYIALQSVDAIIAILQWRKQRIRYHFSKGTVLRFEFELYHRFKWLQSLFFFNFNPQHSSSFPPYISDLRALFIL